MITNGEKILDQILEMYNCQGRNTNTAKKTDLLPEAQRKMNMKKKQIRIQPRKYVKWLNYRKSSHSNSFHSPAEPFMELYGVGLSMAPSLSSSSLVIEMV